jgi:ABC-type transport system involved in multi-copper enzyme maturation permease subunit
MKTLAVATNTFREARRDRVQWILLFYAIIVIAGAWVLSPLALGEAYRVTRDLGLAALSLVGVVLIALVGGGLVQKEIDRKTVFTILAKPIRRSEFLFGKFLGLMGMVTAVFCGMVVFLSLVLFLREGGVEPAVLVAAGFTYGELVILTAVVVTFSCFVSPILSGVFTLAVFGLGHFSADLLRFAEQSTAPIVAPAARVIYMLLPHLDRFNLRAEAAYSVVPDPVATAAALGYAVLYSASLLAVAVGILSRREFR